MSEIPIGHDSQLWLMSRAMGGNIESRELPDGAYEHAVRETPMPQSQALRLLEYPIVEEER